MSLTTFFCIVDDTFFCIVNHIRTSPYAASVVSSVGSTIERSSFSGLLTRVEIGHIRIRSVIAPLSASSLALLVLQPQLVAALRM